MPRMLLTMFFACLTVFGLTSYADDPLHTDTESVDSDAITLTEETGLESVDTGLLFPDVRKQMIVASGLPYCGVYWPAAQHWEGETIEQRNSRSGLLYETGPNCAMVATDLDHNGECDCGPDCGKDYMLSFYFGQHDQSMSQLKPMLRWYSTDRWARVTMGNASGRVYEQIKGEARPEDKDNYNIYICIPGHLGNRLSTFRMRKY